MIIAFSISPAAADETGSVGEAVAEAVRVVRESGLPHETNAMFTNVEGEWTKSWLSSSGRSTWSPPTHLASRSYSRLISGPATPTN
jgi:thiamine-binding protein